MSSRIVKIAETFWRHKKKSVAFLCLSAYGLNRLDSRIKDDQIRRIYAEKAKQFGLEFVAPNQPLRRVTVLVNREARDRNAGQIFNKNALPLLNLAGLDVNVIQVKSEAEMEQIANAIDTKEADCLFLVGGDGTICRVLSAICRDGTYEQKLPIGLFPGGQRNLTFRALDFVPEIKKSDIVRLCCQSAMALIENVQQTCYPIKCTFVDISDKDKIQNPSIDAAIAEAEQPGPSSNTDNKTYWLFSEIAAGWFEHCEQKSPKFWWMGPLKKYFTCTWELLLKNQPEPLRVALDYEEYCQGCNKCVQIQNAGNKPSGLLGWITWLTGLSDRARTPADRKLMELSRRENPNCGIVHSLAINGTDIRLGARQAEDSSKLLLQAVLTLGRLGTFREACRRLTDGGLSTVYANADIDESELESEKRKTTAVGTKKEMQRVRVHFTHLPKNIQKLAISGDWMEFDADAKDVLLETARQGLRLFKPRTHEI